MRIFIPFLALLLSACSSVGLNPKAHMESEFPEHDYLIILKGTHALMVHDSISAIFDRTYSTEAHIRIKKREGSVSASEAQIIQLDDFGKEKRVKLIQGAEGTFIINNDKLAVDLKVPYPDGNGVRQVPFDFNGNYSLERW